MKPTNILTAENTLQTLQDEMVEWQAHNFPTRSSMEPFMGIVEEVGELAHALLKQHQKIRGTSVEHEAKIMDAVADIVVFAADFCNAMSINLHLAVCEAWEADDALVPDVLLDMKKSELFIEKLWFEVLKDIVVDVGHVSEALDRVSNGIFPMDLDQAIGMLVVNLHAFCVARGYDMKTLIQLTWAKVSQRDWQADPSGKTAN